MSDNMDTTTAAPVMTDPFARLLEQEKAARPPLSAPVLPAPPGGSNPFLNIPGAEQTPAPEPVTAAAEETVPEVPEVPVAPKRKRGRPRKHPLPVESTKPGELPADPEATRDLILSLPPDRAWVVLGDLIAAAGSRGAEFRKQAEEAERNRAEIETLRGEIDALQAKIGQLTEAGAELGDAGDLLRQAKITDEQAERAETLRKQIAEFLVSLNGGSSGTVGAVRITVIDGKAHLDRSG